MYSLEIRNRAARDMTMTIQTAIRTSLYVLASGFVLLTAGTATAQDAGRLAEADANGDGKITWQEMVDMRAGVFERLDRDGDGFASSDDSPGMGPGKRLFSDAFGKVKSADANGDGRISKDEMLNGPAPLFEKGDTDGDKVLSAAELAALRQTDK
ncbi:hypothetical protein GCM10011317_46540 [Niveispirillum cyanobacteriorum]|nr:hypothetical protein GCM10011317_46540 [Niveispirillum cyanobacteriorum]